MTYYDVNIIADAWGPVVERAFFNGEDIVSIMSEAQGVADQELQRHGSVSRHKTHRPKSRTVDASDHGVLKLACRARVHCIHASAAISWRTKPIQKAVPKKS